jgi:hypothetical protein
MGDHFQVIVDTEVVEEESQVSAENVSDWLIQQGIVLAGMTDCRLSFTRWHKYRNLPKKRPAKGHLFDSLCL